MNLSSRKTCQNSWVASLFFSVSWWRVSLAQSVARANSLKLSFLLLVRSC
ncbi:hypothetical protein EFT81_24865 [Vibrio parahaemolyticus]|nr:hypothetical protein [Vibrio parahaemolyticus]